MRPRDLSAASKGGEPNGGALVLKGNPDVIIVLVLGESNLLHIQQLAETAEKYQKLAGTPVITQYEIILHRFLVGYIIPSPNSDSSPGMGGTLSALVEIEDICKKRDWHKVVVISNLEHLQWFQQQQEGISFQQKLEGIVGIRLEVVQLILV